MSYYYWFNREELVKSALYYQKNKEMIEKREKDRYRSMTDIDRNEKKRKSLERYYKLKAQYKE